MNEECNSQLTEQKSLVKIGKPKIQKPLYFAKLLYKDKSVYMVQIRIIPKSKTPKQLTYHGRSFARISVSNPDYQKYPTVLATFAEVSGWGKECNPTALESIELQ